MSISPNLPPPSSYNPPPPPAPSSGGNGLKFGILFGLVAALVAGNVYSVLQLNEVKADLTKTKDALASEIARVQDASSVTTQTHRRSVDTLRDQLVEARKQASAAAGQARIDAIRRTEELTQALAREQEKSKQEVRAEISEVKDVATTATTKIGEVSTEVGTVKSDLGAAKSELEKTVANLKRVTGELSDHGSLIATNGTELAALKALGERNYFEFRLGKTKEPQRVGDIAVVLKKADMKRNRYTIELLVDDKRVEKKDKTLNEPVQFLTMKARQPYEIVVNEVKKDQIAGYLATPKVQAARN
jgi:hypothetical protein